MTTTPIFVILVIVKGMLNMRTNIRKQVLPTSITKIKKSELEEIQKILENEAKYFLAKHFNMELEIPIEINARLIRTMGFFEHSTSSKRPIKISISKRMIVCAIVMGEMDVVLDTLRHELVHYALYMDDKAYRDGQLDFETKIMELGVGSSGATKVDKIKTNKVGRFYRMLPVYTCTKCNDRVTVRCGLSKGKVMVRCSGCEKVQIFEPTKNVEILFYDYNIK